MSFSKDIKEELSKLNTLSNKDNVKFELIGYLISNNANIVKEKSIGDIYTIACIELTAFIKQMLEDDENENN